MYDPDGRDLTNQRLGLHLGHQSLGRLEVSQFDPGKSFSFKGKRHEASASRQAALILTIDQLMEESRLPCPNYIKIDVPHLTESIIRGGMNTLRRKEVLELHLEGSDESSGDRSMLDLLSQLGFSIAGKYVREGTTDLTLTKRS